MTVIRDIATDRGTARVHLDRSWMPRAALALCHGAGRGIDAPDLVALAKALPAQGISVYRIEQPWVVAGKRVAPRPEALDEATDRCLSRIRPRVPLILGGRSAGARSACRMARSQGAIGCVALAFPLHAPGKGHESRLPELLGTGVPTLVVQGGRDSFGAPDEFPPGVDLTVVPDADHSFAVPKRSEVTQEQALDVLVEAVIEWITLRVGLRG